MGDPVVFGLALRRAPAIAAFVALAGCGSSQSCSGSAPYPATLLYPTTTSVALPVNEVILAVNTAYVIQAVNVRTSGMLIPGDALHPVPLPAPTILPLAPPGYANLASNVRGVQADTMYTVTLLVSSFPCSAPSGYYDVGTFTTAAAPVTASEGLVRSSTIKSS